MTGSGWRGPAIALGLVWLAGLGLAVGRVVDPWHVLVLAGVVTAAVVATRHQDFGGEPALPDLPFHAHAGARRDVSDLSWWAVDRDGRITAATASRIVAALGDQTGPQADRLRRRLATRPAPGPATVLNLLDPPTPRRPHHSPQETS